MSTMTDMPEYRTITDAKAHLNEIVEALKRGGEHVIVTRKGLPAAIMMSWDEWEGWLETVEVLATPGALEGIRAAEAELAEGRFATLDDVIADLKARREVASEE